MADDDSSSLSLGSTSSSIGVARKPPAAAAADSDSDSTVSLLPAKKQKQAAADDDSSSLSSLGSSSAASVKPAAKPAKPAAADDGSEDSSSSSSLESSEAAAPAETADDPSNKAASTGFRRFMAQKLGDDGVETVTSFLMSRAGKKQEAALWGTYMDLKKQGKIPAAAKPAKAEKKMEKAAPSVPKKAVKAAQPAASDEVSSVLDSSDAEPSAVPAPAPAPAKRKLDESSDELTSSDDDAEEGQDGAGYTEADVDAYILAQKWVPDMQSLHSFKSGRKYTSKFLPLIEAALKEKAAQPPAKKQKVQAEAEEADGPEVSGRDAVLNTIILEMNPNLTEADLATYKTSRAFKKKEAELEAAVEERLKNPNAVAAPAAKGKGAQNDAAPDVDAADEGPSVGEQLVKDHFYGEKPGPATAVLCVTNVPQTWYSEDAEGVLTTQRSYQALLKEQKAAGKPKDAKVLMAKLAKLENEHKNVLKAYKTIPDRLKDVLGSGVTDGLASSRSVSYGQCFTGVCILRYKSTGAAAKAFECLKAKGDAAEAGWDECVSCDLRSEAQPLLFTLIKAALPPAPKADGRLGSVLYAQPPDVAPPRKRKYDAAEKEKWWGQEFKKQKAEPAAAAGVAELGVPTNEQIEARKQEEKAQEAKEKAAKHADNVAKAQTFEDYVMAKMDLPKESLDSYMSSRKFLKVKADLEKEYAATK
eukprot:TRINITY_DN2471_c0_g2_i1.p1 TRINITY_DN2471_c0_g2~~TRINITY_DN2471_c0_g2_i1.p1  ORF type:complete len:719 (+),score=320.08 TRINITY_DN2471_c0_g2_i1:59-2158(+)